MKTGLFYEIYNNSEAAKSIFNDLSILFNLKPEHRTLCVNNLLKIAQDVMTSNQRRALVEKIAKESEGLSAFEVNAAMKVLGFYMKQLADKDYEDTATNDLANDLIECGSKFDVPINDNEKRIFIDIINTIRKDIIPKYENIKDEQSTVAGVLPSVKSFATTVELRAVVGNPFRIGMKADDGYDPKIGRVVPVVSIRLATDSGVVDEIAFQLSEQELGALIEELKSAQICLDKMREFIKAHSSPNKQQSKITEEYK
jgi:hypothetical protein